MLLFDERACVYACVPFFVRHLFDTDLKNCHSEQSANIWTIGTCGANMALFVNHNDIVVDERGVMQWAL